MSLKKYLILSLLFLTISCSKRQEEGASVTKDVSVDKDQNTFDHSIRLTKNSLKRIKKYESVIKKYSNKYDVDWRLIVAIIMRESSFHTNAVSRVGAKGLMQIMPRNEEYLESELDIDYIYERPEENIKAGIYHLKQQLDFFNEVQNTEFHMKIALASYNAGYGRVRDAINLSHYLNGNNPYAWKNIKLALNKLKPKDYELHLDVWISGKPKYGYFKNPKETIVYVEKIMNYHDYFSTVFEP